jgi:hypothetical protein
MRFGFLVAAIAASGAASIVACGSSDTQAVEVVNAGDADVPPQVPPPPPGDDGGDADAAAPVTQDLSSSPKSRYESEDQIAVSSDGTLGVLYSTVGTNSEGMGYRFSSDDGKTWSTAGSITLTDLFPGDPAITTDAAGNFWAAFLGIHLGAGNVDYTQVFVAKAPKGSTTFGAPVMVSDPAALQKFRDHPKIFVTKAGTIVIAYMETDSITSGTAAGVSATSTNGTDWVQHPLVGAPAANFANLFSMCESTGALYAAFFEIKSATFDIGIRKSADQGATWSATTVVSTVGELPAGLDMRCAASGNDVWVMYGVTDAPAASETVLDSMTQIVVAHSTDGAGTFPDHKSAMDDKAAPKGTLPELVRMDDGTLVVAYIAGKADPDTSGSVRFTSASAGGAFGASTVVDSPDTYTLSRTSQAWMGDYWGLAARGKSLYFAYPQNASGRDHIYFRKMTLP